MILSSYCILPPVRWPVLNTGHIILYYSSSNLIKCRARLAPCILHADLDRSWIDRPCEVFYDTLCDGSKGRDLSELVTKF